MSSKWTTANIPDQNGKVTIITGANSGVGLQATIALCRKYAVVTMAVRDLKKGEQAMATVKAAVPGANVQLAMLDLADLESVKSFAQQFAKTHDRLDVLMNNAGVMYPAKRSETKQGFELQIGTNHLGHFALTGQLMDLIKRTPHARIVSQASLAHITGDISLDDINRTKGYNRIQAYAQSKLANLLFTYELDRRLKAHFIDAIATVAHPGVSKTNLMRTSGFMIELFTPLMAQSAEMGALPILRAATDPGLKGGEYIGPDGFMGIKGYPVIVKSNRKSYNEELAVALWALSEKMTGVKFGI